MKFICTQENLNHGLNVVSQIAYKNTTLPILNNVLIESKNGIITLSTTNLELAIKCIVRGKVEEDDVLTINAKLLSEYVNLLPKDKINIKTVNNVMNVSCQNFSTKINGQVADDFPLIPQLEKKNSFSAPALEYKKALQQVVFAASNDDNRAEINGVLFLIENNQLTMVATDSFRLSERKILLNQNTDEPIKIIVPLYTVQQLLRILGDADKNSNDALLEFYISNDQIAFNYNNVTVISRLINGEYPDYKQIIPKEYKTTFVINKHDFSQVIKNVSLFCRLGINDIHLSFFATNNEIAIKATNSELGENIGKVIGDGKGIDNQLVFNYKYIIDGLNNINEDSIKLQVIDSVSSGMITGIGDESFRYIVMPIRQ